MKKKFLSAVMVIAILLTMLPVTAAAAGGAGTSSDPYTVSTAEELQTALTGTGGEAVYIRLTQDIIGDFKVPTGRTVNLDLNGKSLTNQAGDTITVEINASLTINGSGSVDNKSNGKAAIFNNGTVVLNGGTYDRTSETGESADISGGNSWYTLCNHGTMTINGDVTVKNTGKFSSMVENGYQSYTGSSTHGDYAYNYKEGVNSPNPTLTINGGTFDGGLNAVKNDDGGVLTIRGGTFTNTTQAAVLNWNQAAIHGGTFVVTAEGYSCILNGAYAMEASEQDLGQLTIDGGSFVSPDGITCVQNHFSDEKPSVSGGTFSGPLDAAFCENGYKTAEVGGKTVVVTDSAEPVATIGELGFNSLANAVAAAQKGQTVKLEKDYTVETLANTEYNLPENAVLDLGGHTLTVPYMTAIFQGENVTIENGTVSSNADYALWIGNETQETSITVQNVSVTGGINVYGAKATLRQVNVDASGKDWYAVWGDWGSEVVIESGTYEGGNGYAALVYGGSGVPGKMTIQGGTFDGDIGVDKAVGAAGQYLTVLGGTFDAETDLDPYLADGMQAVENQGGSQQTVKTIFASGNGTEADPYRIETEEQLWALAADVNAGHSYAGKYLQVTQDITL